MSQRELDRVTVIERVISKRIKQVDAAKTLRLSARQVRRIVKRYEQDGAAGLVSKRRGQASNNQLTTETKRMVIDLIKERYHDFGPTLAHEKLREIHQVHLSVESTRQLMIASGVWAGKQRKHLQVHQTRHRRSQYGELIQVDGSDHDWFEGRGERCTLHVMIDDATGRIMALYFTENECASGYFAALHQYLKQHGRPLCLYSDRHSIFRVNIKEAEKSTGETQLGRALRELGIELICANSPQAKGRVERANGTLQDRLVKEMRLEGISDIPAANAFLPTFIEMYNKKFAVDPPNPIDAHQATIPDDQTLKMILSEQTDRKISKNLEVRYDNKIYQILSEKPSYSMRNKAITVVVLNNEIILLYKGKSLPYEVFDKQNRPAAVATKKEIRVKKLSKPDNCHPWKNRYQAREKMLREIEHAAT